MKHFSHEHALVLNDVYIAREGDKCRGCSEQIFSSKSFVYSCSGIGITSDVDNASCAGFLLHKSCAELPTQFPKPTNPNEFLQLSFEYSSDEYLIAEHFSFNIKHCDICGIRIPVKPEQFFYSDSDLYVCLKCVFFQTQQSSEDPKFNHPAHSQHPLSLIQHPSSFKCYACNVDDKINDMSYRCTKCQFWMHKTCADAPTTFQFQFHDKHSLTLLFSLPKVFHKFVQYCRLCNETLSRSVWLYGCLSCRFFTHFHCARSNHISSSCENEESDSDVVHLPLADESLMANLLPEESVKVNISLDDNNDSILSSINGTINHWTHKEHHLQLINSNEFYNQNGDDKMLLLCNGCVKSIRSEDDQFYGCVPCKYFLHMFCAKLPKVIKHNLSPGYAIARKHNESFRFFYCNGCGVWGNGMFFRDSFLQEDFHFGCLTLPNMIKHEAHHHKFERVLYVKKNYCRGCGVYIIFKVIESYECKQCDYHICVACIMMARVINHPWDSHPLHLIYEPGLVLNHEHEFNCEFCSEDIDTNYWFYHCSICDLSFHLDECFKKSCFRDYSSVKFGATDIFIDKLHRHSLKFVLNRKSWKCERCCRNLLGKPVLECGGPCGSIFCTRCALAVL